MYHENGVGTILDWIKSLVKAWGIHGIICAGDGSPFIVIGWLPSLAWPRCLRCRRDMDLRRVDNENCVCSSLLVSRSSISGIRPTCNSGVTSSSISPDLFVFVQHSNSKVSPKIYSVLVLKGPSALLFGWVMDQTFPFLGSWGLFTLNISLRKNITRESPKRNS